MFKKLDKMLERYDKLNELVSDSNVIAKMDEWKAYTKELADITETVDKYLEYKKVLKEKEDIDQSLPKETDPEMKALLQEESNFLRSVNARIDDKINPLTREKGQELYNQWKSAVDDKERNAVWKELKKDDPEKGFEYENDFKTR